MAYIILVIGFILLVKCADIFVSGSSNLAKSLGIPSLIIGLTIVAFGTSAPEATVSIISSLEEVNGIAVGNILGSNICNLLLVLGVCALFKPLVANKQIIKKDFPFLIFCYILFLIFIIIDYLIKIPSILDSREGLFFLIILFIYLYDLIKQNVSREKEEKIPFKTIYLFNIIFGIIGTIIGGNAVVDAATKIADSFGVSDHLIGLTIIAIGTSLPELVTSVIATIKGETDLAIGNVIGSNIFNILFILGTCSVIKPLPLSINMIIDLVVMLISGLIVYSFCKKEAMNKTNGAIMILIYITYVIYIVLR